MSEFGAQKLVLCRDPDAGLEAVIAIHSNIDGQAGGGVRMRTYATEASAIRDALRLAQAMSRKYAAIGIPLGGAKAVILGDPNKDKTERLLRAFGRCVQEQGGEYWVGEDVGTTGDDMVIVGKETEYMVSLPTEAGGQGDVSVSTAAGVLEAMRACCQRRWGTPSVAERSVAVQGLGQVGMKLARMLVEAGAAVTVCDVDRSRTRDAASRLGVTVEPPERFVSLPVDILSPCALGDVIDRANVEDVTAEVVAGAANNIFADVGTAERLEERGSIYAVDFIANAGALIYDPQMLRRPRPTKFDDAEAKAYLDGIFDRTLEVFKRAEADGQPLWQAAVALADEKAAQ